MQLPGCLARSAEHGAERDPRRALRCAGQGKQHLPCPSGLRCARASPSGDVWAGSRPPPCRNR
eukprot:2862466-Alexandrium_andersonii.AAC.1